MRACRPTMASGRLWPMTPTMQPCWLHLLGCSLLHLQTSVTLYFPGVIECTPCCISQVLLEHTLDFLQPHLAGLESLSLDCGMQKMHGYEVSACSLADLFKSDATNRFR